MLAKIKNVEGLQAALNGKSNTGHTHSAADIVSGTLALARIPDLLENKVVGMLSDAPSGYQHCSVVQNPKGGQMGIQSGGVVGAVKITIPYLANTMLTMELDVYEYVSGRSCTITIAGYVYSGSNLWYNYSVHTESGSTYDPQVRLCFDATLNKFCFILGTTSSVWEYPQINIKSVKAGYADIALDNWNDGWTIEVIGSETGITTQQTFTNNLTGADLGKSKGILSLAVIGGSPTEGAGWQYSAVAIGYNVAGNYGWITAGGPSARTTLYLNGGGGEVQTGGQFTVAGQGRFKGWYSGSDTGVAAEVGVSGGVIFLLGYDRTSGIYKQVYIQGGDGVGGGQSSVRVTTGLVEVSHNFKVLNSTYMAEGYGFTLDTALQSGMYYSGGIIYAYNNVGSWRFSTDTNSNASELASSGAAAFSSTVSTTGNLTVVGGGAGYIRLYSAYSGSPSNVGIEVVNYAGTLTFQHNANGGGTYIGGVLTQATHIIQEAGFHDFRNTAYLRFSNTGGGTRWAYVQHDGSNLAYVVELGVHAFIGAAEFGSTITAPRLNIDYANNAYLVRVQPAIYGSTNTGSAPFTVAGHLILQARTSGAAGDVIIAGGNGTVGTLARFFGANGNASITGDLSAVNGTFSSSVTATGQLIAGSDVQLTNSAYVYTSAEAGTVGAGFYLDGANSRVRSRVNDTFTFDLEVGLTSIYTRTAISNTIADVYGQLQILNNAADSIAGILFATDGSGTTIGASTHTTVFGIGIGHGGVYWVNMAIGSLTTPALELEPNGNTIMTYGAVVGGQLRILSGAYNNGNGRSMTWGYSGSSYGAVGYNVAFTASNGVYYTSPDAGTDYASLMIMEQGGFVFKGTTSTVAANTVLSLTELLVVKNGSFTYKGDDVVHDGNIGTYLADYYTNNEAQHYAYSEAVTTQDVITSSVVGTFALVYDPIGIGSWNGGGTAFEVNDGGVYRVDYSVALGGNSSGGPTSLIIKIKVNGSALTEGATYVHLSDSSGEEFVTGTGFMMLTLSDSDTVGLDVSVVTGSGTQVDTVPEYCRLMLKRM